MTTEWVNTHQSKINKMDFCELQDYREEIAASCLDNPMRFYLYDMCDARLQALDPNTAIVVCDDSEFDFGD